MSIRTALILSAVTLCVSGVSNIRAAYAQTSESRQDSSGGAPPGAPTRISDQTFRLFGLPAPGYTWGQLRYPSSLQKEEVNNLIVEGEVFQSLEKPLTGRLFVGPLVDLYYQKDTVRFDYYNNVIFALGGQLRWQPLDWISISLGGREEWDFKPVSDRQSDKFVGLLTWYAFRQFPIDDGAATAFAPTRYLLLARGLVRYPSSHELKERNNAIINGAFELSADLSTEARRLLINTFIGLDYKADVQQFDYNNWVTPSVGAKLKIIPSDHVQLEIGAKLASEYRFVSDRTRTGPVVFVNWSADW